MNKKAGQDPILSKKRESVSFESLDEAKAYDSLIKHKLKYERDFFRREEQEPENTTQDLTLEEATYLYLKDKQFPEKCLRDFLYKAKCFLPRYGGYTINEITKADLEKIAKSMSSEGLTSITIKRKLSCLSSVLHWAGKNEYLDKVPPMPEISGGKNMHFVPPTLDEISIMYANAAPHLDTALQPCC